MEDTEAAASLCFRTNPQQIALVGISFWYTCSVLSPEPGGAFWKDFGTIALLKCEPASVPCDCRPQTDTHGGNDDRGGRVWYIRKPRHTPMTSP